MGEDISYIYSTNNSYIEWIYILKITKEKIDNLKEKQTSIDIYKTGCFGHAYHSLIQSPSKDWTYF